MLVIIFVTIHLPLCKRGIEGDLFRKSPLTPLFQRGGLANITLVNIIHLNLARD